MPLPRSLFAHAFREGRLGLVTMGIIAAMVYLSGLTMTAETALSRLLGAWGSDLQGRLTIQIQPQTDEGSLQRTERVRAATDFLMSQPDIALVTLVPEEESQRLLKPWISDATLLKTLPLPTLIDIRAAQGRAIAPDELKNRIAPVVRGVEVDGPESWLADVSKVVRGIGFVAWTLVSLTAAIAFIALGLICRVALGLQHRTIGLLHMLGAHDKDIARAFETQIARLAFPAALAGTALAAATLAGLFALYGRFGGVPVHWSALGYLPPVVLCAVPVIAVLGVGLLTRILVYRFLRREAR